MKEMILIKPYSILLHGKRLFIRDHVSRFNTLVNPYFIWIHGKFFILRNKRASFDKLILFNNKIFYLNQYSISHVNEFQNILLKKLIFNDQFNKEHVDDKSSSGSDKNINNTKSENSKDKFNTSNNQYTDIKNIFIKNRNILHKQSNTSESNNLFEFKKFYYPVTTIFKDIISKKIEQRDYKNQLILYSHSTDTTNIYNSSERGFEENQNSALNHFYHNSMDKDFIGKKVSNYKMPFNSRDAYIDTEQKVNSVSANLDHIKPAQEALYDLKNSVDIIKKQLDQQETFYKKPGYTNSVKNQAIPDVLMFSHQNLEILTDKVYRMLEMKMIMEKERRGIRCW